jgi:hypothetical protein
MKYKTINEAAHAWVGEFNAIPQGVIQKLLERDYDDVMEITPPAIGDRVYIYNLGKDGEIVEILEDGEMFKIDLDDGETVNVERSKVDVQRYDDLPMWGTMWSFGDSADDYWIGEMGGLQIMANCGFRIYEQEDFGYVFGIDGAGYDFYESHWIPLYKARGLLWHEENGEV